MAKMSEYLPLPKTENDSTHYGTLGRGLTNRLKSGINYARETLSGLNERVDRAVEEPFLNFYKKISNNPASDKWVGRNKGTLLTIAAIAGTSALAGYGGGRAADAVVFEPESTGRHVVYYGSPFVLKEIITVVNSEHPLGYTLPPVYHPENIGKNGLFCGLVALGFLSTFLGSFKFCQSLNKDTEGEE